MTTINPSIDLVDEQLKGLSIAAEAWNANHPDDKPVDSDGYAAIIVQIASAAAYEAAVGQAKAEKIDTEIGALLLDADAAKIEEVRAVLKAGKK